MRRNCLTVVVCLAAGAAAVGRADCIQDVPAIQVAPFSTITTLFPNWVQAPTSAFQIAECDDTVCGGFCTTSNLNGLTILNYGTATNADLTGMYFRVVCGATNVIQTMTYAGVWNGKSAWTWAGAPVVLPDACTNCACALGLYVYTDIAPCPTDGRTVVLGPGYDDLINPAWPGGVYDSCGCAGPWGPYQDAIPKTIRYIAKTADRPEAAPGDTVTYTITYGRPGTTALTNLWVTDTLPPTTHYAYVSSPAPDTGFDPDWGPPTRLRWTLPGGATTGGPTGQITFQASVDWGNGESFEPGSGDVAATEGAFLFNQAHLAWTPNTTCAPGHTSNVPSLVVRRYLFWMIGDNDVLFAPRLGMPDDEMIYSIVVRNVSATKTWWDLRIWDTVPSQLTSWGPGYGFDDPCLGWTMTPGGCAQASPGRTVAGATTLLTWRLDLPPSATLEVRWKARLLPTTPSGATAINQLSIMALGRSGIINGTGSAVVARTFTHQALVFLRTTYTSYVGLAGDNPGSCSTEPWYFINLYPLNKAADAVLYRQWCCAAAPCNTGCDPFAIDGGVSPKIDIFGGTCAAGPATDWIVGCKVERAPAQYRPTPFNTGSGPSGTFNFLHKLVANSPFIWELETCFSGGGEDANTLAGTTSLTYAGYISYTYLRVANPPNELECLYIGNVDPNVDTTLHLFQWNAATLTWDYLHTQDIYRESQWDYMPVVSRAHYRMISSAAPIVVHKAYLGIGVGGAFNDFGTLYPNRENGNLVNATTPAHFYFWAPAANGDDSTVVGNVGAVNASYQLWVYKPFDPTLASPTLNITSDLVDSAGSWEYVGNDVVPPGLTAPLNPKIYGNGYDTGVFLPTYKYYKLILTGNAGAAIQLYAGREIFSGYSGGAVLHSSDPVGSSYGREYWIHEATANNSCKSPDYDIDVIDVFSPKINLGVNLVSHDNYSATYTTNDVDECIAFKCITTPTGGNRRNWKIAVTAGGNPGDVIAQYICCIWKEKFYAAPFLAKGVYYDILAPPTVYAGQSFWLTVVVMEAGTTKTDYCGTSSFTSTDATAQMQGTPMDGYNFTWTSQAACTSAPDENGVKIFVNVSFTKLGLQTLVASDIVDGSITGLATIMVVGADIKLEKNPRLTVGASGDTVQFRVCWSNYSSASGFSFTITDALPEGTTFLPEAGTAAFDCGSTKGVGTGVAYSTTASSTPPATFTTGNPAAGTRWLRFTVPVAGVNTTGCVCYRVTVD